MRHCGSGGKGKRSKGKDSNNNNGKKDDKDEKGSEKDEKKDEKKDAASGVKKKDKDGVEKTAASEKTAAADDTAEVSVAAAIAQATKENEKDGGSSSSTTQDGKPADGSAAAASTTSATSALPPSVRDMKPRELMAQLDSYIVGQQEAKRAVSVALRNRWRRHQVPSEELRDEISPKNILMVGPTGVGKTEIARRLAKLTDAPFIKVEATKFTEVGFHGRDVDTIIEDLLKTAVSQTKQVLMRRHEAQAREKAEDRILQALAGTASGFREHLRNGSLNRVEVTLDLMEKKDPPKSAGAGGGTEGMHISVDIPSMMGLGRRHRMVKKTLKIGDAMPLVIQEELDKLVETADLQAEALKSCEEDGIVVIDEIDKIVAPSGSAQKGHQASAEGVQQDLLPLVEGTTVTTKNGTQVKTDKILFICSGAFHMVKVSDMLAELQGRLPIRVELKALTEGDFHRILTEPKYNLIRQHTAMLKTEGVELKFTDEAVWELARVAALINRTVQNIGARRLVTVLEKVLEDISFTAPDKAGETVEIDVQYVKNAVESLTKKIDITKFLL